MTAIEDFFDSVCVVNDRFYKLATTRDFQQCGILASVDSDEPVQSPFKLRNPK